VKDAAPRRKIQAVAQQIGAPLYELGTSIRFRSDVSASTTDSAATEPRHAVIDVETPWRSHGGLRSPLAGAHQAANLSLSVAAADCLNAAGWRITPVAITD